MEFFHKLYHFEELITWGGHFVLIAIIFCETGIMAGFFLPGDSLLVTAGLLAAAGHLNIYLLIAELIAAAILGDTLNYHVGKRIGPKIFSRENSLLFNKNHLIRTRQFYDKYGAKTIVIARFVPIVRTFAPTVAGIAEMKYPVFLAYNVIGAVAWVLSMLLTGYVLGRVIPNVDKHVHKIIFIVIFLSICPAIYEIWKERRANKQP